MPNPSNDSATPKIACKPCEGCGNSDPSKRCAGCLHAFTPDELPASQRTQDTLRSDLATVTRERDEARRQTEMDTECIERIRTVGMKAELELASLRNDYEAERMACNLAGADALRAAEEVGRLRDERDTALRERDAAREDTKRVDAILAAANNDCMTPLWSVLHQAPVTRAALDGALSADPQSGSEASH